MSFSQLKYDDDTYVHRLKESIGPGDYMLNMPTNNCYGCYYFAPGLAMTRAVSCKNPIDVDSELFYEEKNKEKKKRKDILQVK